jgi:serine/tyrosine/threonine adenylyltransferase
MLAFSNRLIAALPKDPIVAPGSRAVTQAFSFCAPTPVSAPRLLAYAPAVADLLGLSAQQMHSDTFLQAFSGNQLLPGMQPIAVNYGGHQFGHWAGQLGDGRAISLGETVQGLELQLKGAGATPYSRHADGRAVLRSSLREFVCSEAMHALGVPTTRALCLIATGESVVRDMFYTGNAALEPGAIVCRVAPSFIRFGNFELPAARGDIALLRQWADFCIARDFPALAGGPNAYGDWFAQICQRTAHMVVHWLRVGFVHGVMNTDNMSVLGLTIDYGPYGWLENFDPNWTPNTTDKAQHRYAFGKQAQVAQWNLSCLASALAPLCPDQSALHAGLALYAEEFNARYQAMSAEKLGFAQWRDADLALQRQLHSLMQDMQVDMTIFYTQLAQLSVDETTPEQDLQHFAPAFYQPALAEKHAPEWLAWLQQYRVRTAELPNEARLALMRAANPIYVPRNWLLQQSIDAAQNGDLDELHTLMRVLAHPYEAQAGMERFAERRPGWAESRAGCSMLSCSS